MALTGIERITYGVSDLSEANRFFGDWGLKRRGGGKSASVFETLDGSQVVVRAADTGTLPAPIQKGNTVREVTWGVSSNADLTRIARELEKDRKVTIDKEGTVRSTDDVGLGLAFQRTKRRRVAIERNGVNGPARVERIDRQSTIYKRAHPHHISHVVLLVPDLKKQERFYTGRLGFTVSDRYPGKGVFLRYAPVSDHHTLFMMESPDGPRFHHAAFAVRDVHEVFGGGIHFAGKGWKTEIGPGRHPISSAIFWYFKNPCGGIIEYCADEDRMTPKWKPRNYKLVPENFAEWTLPDGIDNSRGDVKERRN